MNPRQKSKITSRHPHKNGSVQPEFHGMPVGRHETLAVVGGKFCFRGASPLYRNYRDSQRQLMLDVFAAEYGL